MPDNHPKYWQVLQEFSNIVNPDLHPIDLKDLTRFCLKNKYPLLILAHLMLGALIYWKPNGCRFYSALLFFSGICYIIKTRNRNQEVLLAAAYVTGIEVLVRMVNGGGYEFAKYTVLIFALLGIYYSGFSKKSWLYVLYLLLLVPSLLLIDGLKDLSRSGINTIIGHLSGPICLGFLSVYAFEKKVSFSQLSNLLLLAALPTVSLAFYVFLGSPDPKCILGVGSNNHFSGLFGPNQVSTALGLGMFIFFARAILNSEPRTHFALNLSLGTFLGYTGLLTFSRAGMITGFFAMIATVVFVFLKSESYGRQKAKLGLVAFLFCFTAIFVSVSYQTHGLLVKRYTNRDHLGHTKRDKAGDRRALATEEVKLFVKNPLLGVGVTEAEHSRKVRLGGEYQSHDEITRMLAEHGSLGFIGVLILMLTPGWLFLYKRKNVLLAAFFVFWFLTVNHSSMRLVAPAFFYALMLLEVDLAQASFFNRRLAREPLGSKRFAAAPVSNSI